MSHYRRAFAPGGSWFFTVARADRRSDALVHEIGAPRAACAATVAEHALIADAMVILPDHPRAVWTPPPGETDFSVRWREIKTRFTRALGGDPPRSASQRAKGERGLWQRRYWEHRIRDADDHRVHVEYRWWNPVKHGLVAHPADWPYSSFRRDNP